MEQAAKESVGSPSLEVFKELVDVALGIMVQVVALAQLG